jgi:DNA-binding response OmpR family regulator
MSEGPRVLLVDDDPAMLRLLEVNFRLAGFVVETASRGDDAVTRAIAAPPDALVLDVMMPGLDGYQVGARVREEPSMAATPIVFLTARAMDEDRETGEALGSVDYLTKPFDPQDLVATVQRRLASSRDAS